MLPSRQKVKPMKVEMLFLVKYTWRKSKLSLQVMFVRVQQTDYVLCLYVTVNYVFLEERQNIAVCGDVKEIL